MSESRNKLPMWAIILIIVLVGLLVVPFLLAVLLPATSSAS